MLQQHRKITSLLTCTGCGSGCTVERSPVVRDAGAGLQQPGFSTGSRYVT